VTPLEFDRCVPTFRGRCCFHLQGTSLLFYPVDGGTTLDPIYHTTQRHTTECSNPHGNYSKNHKSNMQIRRLWNWLCWSWPESPNTDICNRRSMLPKSFTADYSNWNNAEKQCCEIQSFKRSSCGAVYGTVWVPISGFAWMLTVFGGPCAYE
jgi:hypothetical protein